MKALQSESNFSLLLATLLVYILCLSVFVAGAPRSLPVIRSLNEEQAAGVRGDAESPQADLESLMMGELQESGRLMSPVLSLSPLMRRLYFLRPQSGQEMLGQGQALGESVKRSRNWNSKQCMWNAVSCFGK